MLEHLRFNISTLKERFPRAGVVIGGDINKLPCEKICDCFPDLVNLVASPTRGNRILDVIVSNLHPAYDKALVLPPLQPDVVGHGSPSDHGIAVARPNVNKAARTGFTRKVTRYRRSMTATNLALLGVFLLSLTGLSFRALVAPMRSSVV